MQVNKLRNLFRLKCNLRVSFKNRRDKKTTKVSGRGSVFKGAKKEIFQGKLKKDFELQNYGLVAQAPIINIG